MIEAVRQCDTPTTANAVHQRAGSQPLRQGCIIWSSLESRRTAAINCHAAESVK